MIVLSEVNKKQRYFVAFIALFLIVVFTISFSYAKFVERNEFLLKLAMAEHFTFVAGEEHSDIETDPELSFDSDVLPETEPDLESNLAIIPSEG